MKWLRRYVCRVSDYQNEAVRSIPWWQGVACRRYEWRDTLLAPVPLHLLIRWARSVNFWLRYPKWSRAEMCGVIRRLQGRLADSKEKLEIAEDLLEAYPQGEQGE